MKSLQENQSRQTQLRNADERRRLVELYVSSGSRPTAFCREHGIQLSTFYGWLKKQGIPSRPAEKSYCFVEAAVGDVYPGSPTVEDDSACMEIILRTGAKIRIRDNTCFQEVSTWLKEVVTC